MARQGSRDPLACLRVVPDTYSQDERADRPFGRSEGLAVRERVSCRQSSWLKAVRLEKTFSEEAVFSGSYLAMDRSRVRGTWHKLSRGFLAERQ